MLHAPQLLRHIERIKVGLAVHSPARDHSAHLVESSAHGALTGRFDRCNGCGGLGCAAGRISRSRDDCDRSAGMTVGSAPVGSVHISQHSERMKCGLRTHSPALAHCPHSGLLSAQLASSVASSPAAAFVASCLRLSPVTSRARAGGWLRAGDKSLIASVSVGVRVSGPSRWRPTSNSNSTTAPAAETERRRNGPLDAGRREEKQVVGSSSASLDTLRFTSIRPMRFPRAVAVASVITPCRTKQIYVSGARWRKRANIAHLIILSYRINGDQTQDRATQE